MGLQSLYKLGLFLGFASLLHVTYSAAQHRTYIRITEQEFNYLPIDIILQAIFSLVLVIVSLMNTIGDFKEIRAVQTKSWETVANLPSFYTFNHRGKTLFSPQSTSQLPVDYDD
ncbi:ER membrane protein complex subunit 5 [Culicoides brevitarsis]|uniref:ER membrane protein complex subunit 5 n=1 Tax=Culicoides brevitarsis TaxID=469753 RepID=UPI00307BD743